jgi:hypothetical protein
MAPEPCRGIYTALEKYCHHPLFGEINYQIIITDISAVSRHFDVTIKRAARVSMKSLYELHDLMPDHVPPAILQALHIVLRELPTEEWYLLFLLSVPIPLFL